MTEIPPPAIHGADPFDGSAMGAAGAVGVNTPVASTAPNYVLVRAMEDVMAVRHQQIFQFGHTPEKDARRAIGHFIRDLDSNMRAIVEDVQFHKGNDRVRRRLVKLAALILATIDRIDNDSSEGNSL